MAEVVPMGETSPIKFDPNKSYRWNKDDQFILTGAEFDLIYKALQARAVNPEFQRFIVEFEALKLVESIFIKGVESGKIPEYSPDENQQEV